MLLRRMTDLKTNIFLKVKIQRTPNAGVVSSLSCVVFSVYGPASNSCHCKTYIRKKYLIFLTTEVPDSLRMFKLYSVQLQCSANIIFLL